jgi:rubrerythrin
MSTLTRKAVVAGGAVAAGSVLISGPPGIAASVPSPEKLRIRNRQDVRILNYFLLIEEVMVGFYADALETGALSGELAQFAEVALAHERKHVKWLRKLLGNRARQKPTLGFPATASDSKAFIKNAIRLEEMNVAAYNGQATNLTREGRVVAARMVSVDARHAAWIHDLAGTAPAEMITDRPLSERQVLSALGRTGFLTSS